MSKPYEMHGEIVNVLPMETVGAKGFRKRVVVMSDGNPKYPQLIPFELTGDAAETAPPLGMATVKFYLQGREWNGRYFSGLRAVEFTPDDAAPLPAPVAPPPGQPPAPAAVGDDKLPF